MTEVTVQSLSIESLYKMQLEFPDIYDQLFNESITILRRTLIQRFKAMKECRLQYIKQMKSISNIDHQSQSNLEFSVQSLPQKLPDQISPKNIYYQVEPVALYQINEESFE